MSTRRKIMINVLLIAAVLAVAKANPAASGPVAVFAAPWSTGAGEVVARAGGNLLAAGRWPWIVVAVSDDTGFVGKLYRAGAILVTDPSLAVGCNPKQISGGTHERS